MGAPSLFESPPWFGIHRPWNEALSDVFAWREIKFQKRCIAASLRRAASSIESVEGCGRRMMSPVHARFLALAANASTAYPGCWRAAARGPHVC